MKNGVAEQNVVVAVYRSSEQAEDAVWQLWGSGFDMKKVSIAGKDDHPEGAIVGYYYSGDRIRCWGKPGESWGPLWDVLFGWAYFVIPGFGSLLVVGPLGAWIVAALNNAPVFGGLSAFGAGLYSVGIPKDSVLKYEAAVKAGNFLVLALGTSDEIARGREILHGEGEGGRCAA